MFPLFGVDASCGKGRTHLSSWDLLNAKTRVHSMGHGLAMRLTMYLSIDKSRASPGRTSLCASKDSSWVRSIE